MSVANKNVAELTGRVEGDIERFLAEMSALSSDQRRYRPKDGAWSPNQVAHHLLLVQSLSVGVMEKNGGRASAPRSWMQKLGRIGVFVILRFGIRVRNPAPPTTPDRDIAFEELEPLWAAERARLQALVATMDDAALRSAGFKHPISGPLTVAESLDFLACHLEHHLRQLDRIRADAGFPAAT